ncbi:MAG: 2-C-methyl-D-erythritol 4-phosphate cytidylyltransferase [Synergistaceae bacterium]|nr:2-C-methyl-D-erythritol 4-phosphate cytidylyltransferase [Synergistaceae bacterium]
MITGAILLAAGSGVRFGGKKQDLIFHGSPLWRYAYNILNKFIDSTHLVAVGQDILGGETRTLSVSIGLANLPDDTERVIIAEAARPFVLPEQVDKLIKDNHDSASFVKPLVNTVIFRDGSYIDREHLYELLTPQAFSFPKLRYAYSHRSSDNFTDETRIMYEVLGIKPFFIETGQNLFKLTYQEDIAVLESLYQHYKERIS